MKKTKRYIIIVAIIMLLALFFGVKPLEDEFACPDSTSRCFDSWGGRFDDHVNGRHLAFSVYGYEFFSHPIFIAVHISEFDSDLCSPRETRVSWFNQTFKQSRYIPNLAIKKIDDATFYDRYIIIFPNDRHQRFVMGERKDYFNPFNYKNENYYK